MLARPEVKWALAGIGIGVGVGVVAYTGPNILRSMNMSTASVKAVSLLETPRVSRPLRTHSEWNKIPEYVKANGSRVASHLRRTR